MYIMTVINAQSANENVILNGCPECLAITTTRAVAQQVIDTNDSIEM